MSSAAVALVLVSCLTHALWNLVSKRSGSTPAFFLLGNLCPLALLPLFVALGGLDVVRSAPPLLWGLLAATGACQACYFAALARAYRYGEISLVYPLARTFPVFVVLLAGFGLGQWPTPQAWLGFAGVVLGCLLLPLGQRAPTGRAR